MATELYFNIDNGYLEGLCRGFRGGILTKADYLNLIQCENVDGVFIEWLIAMLCEGYEDFLIKLSCRRSEGPTPGNRLCRYSTERAISTRRFGDR